MYDTKTLENLYERLVYWEYELEVPLNAHPDPDVRLDGLIEALVDEESEYMERIFDLKIEINQLLDESAVDCATIAQLRIEIVHLRAQLNTAGE